MNPAKTILEVLQSKVNRRNDSAEYRKDKHTDKTGSVKVEIKERKKATGTKDDPKMPAMKKKTGKK